MDCEGGLKMKWCDYREKLGIGFSDVEKVQHLNYKIFTFLSIYLDNDVTENLLAKKYFIKVGDLPKNGFFNKFSVIENIIEHESCAETISRYVALIDVVKSYYDRYSVEELESFIIDSMNELKIPYRIVEYDDGKYIFPVGAKELDDALVSEPLEWLKDYPCAYKTFCIALRQYSEGVYIRDVADNLRKALETFFQEFLGNEKNLESNRIEISRLLGNESIDSGIAGLYAPLVNSYNNINNRIAKHNDAVDGKLLEFLLYQTGLLIRMVIVVLNRGLDSPNLE